MKKLSWRSFARASLALLRASALLGLLLLLGSCSSPQVTASEESLPGVGTTRPEAAVEGFFEDLNKALGDPRTLRSGEARGRWAEQLAGYFAPAERQRQRAALDRMLDEFAAGVGRAMAEARPGQQIQVTLEIRPQPVQMLPPAQQGNRAEIQLAEARLYLKVAQIVEGRQDPLYEQEEPIGRLLGRPDGSIPLVRVDGRWFLSST